MRLALIVPYRDRPDHLNQFLQHYKDFSVTVVEQEEGKPFNRGKLLNIGFLETQADYYCFHDVDMLAGVVDFSYPYSPTQLARSDIQKVGYFGGVTLFNRSDFLSVGGYSNSFYSRAEDNELYFQVLRKGLKIQNRFGNFSSLPHPRNPVEFDPILWRKAKQPRCLNDGLDYCTYTILQVKELKSGKHLIVSL